MVEYCASQQQKLLMSRGSDTPETVTTQAALDVFQKEPPAADNPLVGREDVVCTPHLGASTTEAQEGVSVEIAEAVVSALKACADLRSLHAFAS